MITFLRTNSENSDFRLLIKELDAYLAITDGEEHAFYDQYNKVDSIKEVIVAYDENEPVGCGAIKAFDEQSAEVKRMFVKPERRGERIAPQILTELETWAKALGYEYCVLETGKRQQPAIALYTRSGYQPIPNYGQYIGMDNSVCMKKNL
ncbi:GNAT family N-acetyltransferase [Siphonobacter sp. SORGH_AS_1065]|uniref:GNAT family N-acetyltransferase n=1 Tax=Siphonobacter sp. SORGH_AS_1065 TaxID=3041795 RepID=UPI0027823B69|nr:GNAT family N-acetyltransferase [Siphonobacter sp. SORGH_AS_1065]MDQ1089346.1 putative acetyltransferase [Siphonobacter sp. SORGH_AS_1065]